MHFAVERPAEVPAASHMWVYTYSDRATTTQLLAPLLPPRLPLPLVLLLVPAMLLVVCADF